MKDMALIMKALDDIKALVSRATAQKMLPKPAMDEEEAPSEETEMAPEGEGVTAVKVSVKPKPGALTDEEEEELMKEYSKL